MKGKIRIMITINCKECGKPYTDRVDPRVNINNGGYIICPKCAMNIKPKRFTFGMLQDAVYNKYIEKFMNDYCITERQLSKFLAISQSFIYNLKTGKIKSIKRFERMCLKIYNETIITDKNSCSNFIDKKRGFLVWIKKIKNMEKRYYGKIV